MRIARWLLGPLAGCVAASVVVFIVAKGSNLVHEAMLPSCTHFEPARDYMLCQDWWHMAIMTLLEEAGWFLAVVAFAVTTTIVAPVRKKVVALFCCALGMAFGMFISFDVGSVLPAISSLLASAVTMLWAYKRYGSAYPAQQPHAPAGG